MPSNETPPDLLSTLKKGDRSLKANDWNAFVGHVQRSKTIPGKLDIEETWIGRILSGGPGGFITYTQPGNVTTDQVDVRIIEEPANLVSFQAALTVAPLGIDTIIINLLRNSGLGFLPMILNPIIYDISNLDGDVQISVLGDPTLNVGDVIRFTVDAFHGPDPNLDVRGVGLTLTYLSTEGSDYQNNRYWVERVFIDNQKLADPAADKVVEATVSSETGDKTRFVTATNLAESNSQTHELCPGQLVKVFGGRSRNSSDVRRYWFALMPALAFMYVGGTFAAAGSSPVQNLGIGDGCRWDNLIGDNILEGPITFGTTDSTLFDFGDGLLPVVCGLSENGWDTSQSPPVRFPATSISRWNGVRWVGIDVSLQFNIGEVDSIAVYHDKLYIGGTAFDEFFVKVWNGFMFVNVGGGGPGARVDARQTVRRLIVWQDKLYALGTFNRLNGVDAFAPGWGGMAIWDDSSWVTAGEGVRLGSGPQDVGQCWDAVPWNKRDGVEFGLAVCGKFFDAGGIIDANSVALWDGVQWLRLGAGLPLVGLGGAPASSRAIGSLTDRQGPMLFAHATDNATLYVYDGTDWFPHSVIDEIRGLTLFHGQLIASGFFRVFSDSAIGGAIAVYNPTTDTWDTIAGGVNRSVFDIHIMNSELYIGGDFNDPGLGFGNIAKLNATPAWQAVGGGVTGPVNVVSHVVESTGTHLMVGGSFSTGAWLKLDNSNQWVDQHGISGGEVRTILVTSSWIYVGGTFNRANNHDVGFIIRVTNDGFDTEVTMGIPPGVNYTETFIAHVNSIVEFNGQIYVGGLFDRAGLDVVSNVTRWDPTPNIEAFFQVGQGLPDEVTRLFVFNGLLYASGDFDDGINERYSLARWEDPNWVPIRDAMIANRVDAMTDWNGQLLLDGSTVSPRVQRILQRVSDTQFTVLGDNLETDVRTLIHGNIGSGEQLFVAGGATIGAADQQPMFNLARIDRQGVHQFMGGADAAVRISEHTYLDKRVLFASLSGPLTNDCYAERIARATNKGWKGLDGGVRGPALNVSVQDMVFDALVHDDEVWVVGNFTNAARSDGSVLPAAGVAKWDHCAGWRSIGGGLSAATWAATVAEAHPQQAVFPPILWVYVVNNLGIFRFDEDALIWEDVSPQNIAFGIGNIRDLKVWGGELWLAGAGLRDGNLSNAPIAHGEPGLLNWAIENIDSAEQVTEVFVLFGAPDGNLYVGVSSSVVSAVWKRQHQSGSWVPVGNNLIGVCRGLSWLPEDPADPVNHPAKLVARGEMVLSNFTSAFVATFDFATGLWFPILDNIVSNVSSDGVLVPTCKPDEVYLGGDFMAITGFSPQPAFANMARYASNTWTMPYSNAGVYGRGVSNLSGRVVDATETVEPLANTSIPGFGGPTWTHDIRVADDAVDRYKTSLQSFLTIQVAQERG